jgi:hypothetical protein
VAVGVIKILKKREKSEVGKGEKWQNLILRKLGC